MAQTRTPQTLVAWIAAVARAQGRRPAVVTDELEWSYGELWDRTQAVARHLLHDLDLRPGDRVAIAGTNEPAYLAAYFGVLRAGCVVVPLNVMLDIRAIRDQLELVEAAAVIVGDVDAELGEGIAETLPTFDLGGLAGTGSGYLPNLGPSSPASILLTSGSTGRPKGVVHTQGTLLHASLQMATALPYGPDDRNLAFLPFYTAVGEQILPTLATGGSIRVLPRFDAERVARAAADCTNFDAVPTVMSRLLDQAPLGNLARLRWILFASEPMPVSLLQRWWDALPNVETHQFYGMTEVLPMTFAADRMLREEPATVGIGFPTSRIVAVDEAGAEITDGSPGELICRSPARMLGYHGDKELTAAAWTEDGSMLTGDLGRIDERGRVFLTGRLKDLIISGGLNIAPAEIEAVACRHPGVSAAAVVGIPDQRWGETPVVVAVAAAGGNGFDAGALLAHCREELSSFKRPSAAALIDSMPAIGIGKSDKGLIRKQILDGEIELVRAN
ncbi:MAG: acyl--CoA ligase [Actinobacteria bacterium]|nr:acyl--CoA ligase [Actinomycetota bacterium]